MSLTAGIALALTAVLSGSSTAALSPAPALPAAQTVEQYVDNYFAAEPVMIAVAQCESHFHQYAADGSVYRGEVNHLDVGVMQINEHYHAATAQALGLDLYTIQGNVAYAQYLFEKEGTAPWSSSQPCWGKSPAAQALSASGGSKLALAGQ
jgi:Transglycosylase SLT domain